MCVKCIPKTQDNLESLTHVHFHVCTNYKLNMHDMMCYEAWMCWQMLLHLHVRTGLLSPNENFIFFIKCFPSDVKESNAF